MINTNCRELSQLHAPWVGKSDHRVTPSTADIAPHCSLLKSWWRLCRGSAVPTISRRGVGKACKRVIGRPLFGVLSLQIPPYKRSAGLPEQRYSEQKYSSAPDGGYTVRCTGVRLMRRMETSPLAYRIFRQLCALHSSIHWEVFVPTRLTRLETWYTQSRLTCSIYLSTRSLLVDDLRHNCCVTPTTQVVDHLKLTALLSTTNTNNIAVNLLSQ